MSLTLVTPTRDRPEAFALCVKWMQRQSYFGLVQWIVIDDGDEPTKLGVPGMEDVSTRWNFQYVRRNPSKDLCTLADNLMAAIPKITGEKIVVIEDDEWYGSDYLAQMAGLLNEAELVGENNARYYNVKSRRWWCPDNQKHASLCRTAMKSSMIPALAAACRASKDAGDVFVDLRLWGQVEGSALPPSTKLVPSILSVGVKGMPGRGGAGKSHKWDAFRERDLKLVKLKEWIGVVDAREYERFADQRLLRL